MPAAIGAPPPSRSKFTLKLPKRKPPVQKKVTSTYNAHLVPNTLLVMPNKAGNDDAMQKIREVNGTIVRSIGHGRTMCWEVQFESQESFLSAEKELVKDKNFKRMQRTHIYKPQVLNDQYYGSEYYIDELNVEPAWAQSPGEQNNIIGIVDTGVNPKNMDLAGKCYVGYDCNKDKEKQKDTAGHGTMVATTAAATGNNGVLTAGPARNSLIFPLNAYHKYWGFTDANLLEAVDQCIQRGIKIINMSLNADPPYTIANPTENALLLSVFEDYHNINGGLIFNSCGNSGRTANYYDASPRSPYLIVVTALDETGGLADFSTFGSCVWFTAPGSNIACSTKSGKGKIAYVSGTSFSCPLVASVAALIWGAKPSLTNVQVENKLKATASNIPGGVNDYYGYGLPDASAAMYSALH